MSAASVSRVTGILAPPTCYGTPSSGGSPSVACSTTSARRAPRSWPRDSRASSPTVLAAAADGVRSARPHPSGPDPLRPLRGRRLHARARLSGHRLGRHGVDRARARLLRRGDGATAHGLRVGLARRLRVLSPPAALAELHLSPVRRPPAPADVGADHGPW